MKRKISKSQLDFLQREFSYLQQQNLIDDKQVESFIAAYEVKKSYSFIRVLLTIGSLLIGAGILSFIAANWSEMPKTAKFLIIMSGVIGFYISGWYMEETRPKTSYSLYYIGLSIFGAGIFLVSQMFHLSYDYHNDFLVWTLGTIPLALYLKDRWVALFSIILMAIYMFDWDTYENESFWITLLFVTLLHWLNEIRLERSKLIFFFNNLLLISTFFVAMIRWEMNLFLDTVFFLAIGIAFTFVPNEHYKNQLKWQGFILHGAAGILLTIPDLWYFVVNKPLIQAASFSFALLYAGFILYMLKKGHLPSIIIICALILRYYIDISYDFLPKSLFFVIGGIVLIAFGFWFEKKRKEDANQ